MSNKERPRPLKGIEEEVELLQAQPVEGILWAFLQAFLGNMTETLQESNRQIETSLRETGDRVRDDQRPEVQYYVWWLDPFEGYYNIPSRYYWLRASYKLMKEVRIDRE